MAGDEHRLRHHKTTFRELIQFYCQKSAASRRRSVNINAIEKGTRACASGRGAATMKRRRSRAVSTATHRPPATSAQRLLLRSTTTRRHRGTSPTPTDSAGVGRSPPPYTNCHPDPDPCQPVCRQTSKIDLQISETAIHLRTLV